MAPIEVRAGPLADLRPRAACSRRSARCPSSCSGTTARRYAIEDRCPHLGFPLHQGTVESGLVTCHWHHARFDLVSGLHARPVGRRRAASTPTCATATCSCAPEPTPTRSVISRQRLREGLEDSITLVIAKSVLGLLDAEVVTGARSCAPVSSSAPRTATPVGARASPCSSRWRTCSPTSTPTTALLALTHGLAFVARDTRNHAPRFAQSPARDARPPDRSARGLVPALHRHPLVRRRRTHARDRARRRRRISTRSRR